MSTEGRGETSERNKSTKMSMCDEEWIVSRAKQSLKTDPYAAKAWLLTARTLFPKNFKIQYEAYCIERNSKHIKEVAKILEEMFVNFPKEPQLWQEVWSYSEALQSEAVDEKTVFLKSVFAAFPPSLQYHMLVNVAETTQDVLQQCRLMLLILNKYPDQVPDQGVKLIDSLLSTEKLHQPASPVNCYRKFLVCHVIPQVLNTCPQSSPKHLYRWLQKAIEFYICYITQPPVQDIQAIASPGLQSPTNQRTFSTKKVVIPGLTEKESHIEDPWKQLFDLVQAIGLQLEWDMAGFFDSTSFGAQWQRLQSLWESTSQQADSTAPVKQVLYCAMVLFLHCLYKYASHVDPNQFSAPMSASTSPGAVVLIEALRLDVSAVSEHRSKKLKQEEVPPTLTATPSLSNPSEVTDTFLTALRCWELLHSSDTLGKEFTKLLHHWRSENWLWLKEFEVDVLIYQGYFSEAITSLTQNSTPEKPNSDSKSLRTDLQVACCQYCMGNLAQACERILQVVSGLPVSSDPVVQLPSVSTRGRHLQLIICKETEIFPFCLQLLITCLKERAFNTVRQDDLSLGHMIVLLQFDWPQYEQLFCDILQRIRNQGSFTYNLFFNYIINIDILEEFAFLKSHKGANISLDILPISTKQLTQTRTVTRGVNKGVKEDFKAAIEKQVMRSEENVEQIIRKFLKDEKDIVQQLM